MVASDMTQIAYTGCYYFRCERPRCWFHPLGYGTLGYALPAAIGAKLAAPERATVALAGDAGLLFTGAGAGHRGRARSCRIAIVLWNNDASRQIAEGMVEKGIPEIGVRQRNPGLHQARQGLRLPHRETDEPRPLQVPRSQTAFAADGPTLDRGARGLRRSWSEMRALPSIVNGVTRGADER